MTFKTVISCVCGFDTIGDGVEGETFSSVVSEDIIGVAFFADGGSSGEVGGEVGVDFAVVDVFCGVVVGLGGEVVDVGLDVRGNGAGVLGVGAGRVFEGREAGLALVAPGSFGVRVEMVFRVIVEEVFFERNPVGIGASLGFDFLAVIVAIEVVTFFADFAFFGIGGGDISVAIAVFGVLHTFGVVDASVVFVGVAGCALGTGVEPGGVRAVVDDCAGGDREVSGSESGLVPGFAGRALDMTGSDCGSVDWFGVEGVCVGEKVEEADSAIRDELDIGVGDADGDAEIGSDGGFGGIVDAEVDKRVVVVDGQPVFVDYLEGLVGVVGCCVLGGGEIRDIRDFVRVGAFVTGEESDPEDIEVVVDKRAGAGGVGSAGFDVSVVIGFSGESVVTTETSEFASRETHNNTSSTATENTCNTCADLY